MRLSNEMPRQVSDLMTVDLIALLPVDRVQRAKDLLLSAGIHALPVMDGNDVHGIVTSTDLLDEWADDEQVSAIMTPVPTAIATDASIKEAAELMTRERVHHLMVEDEREVVGILSSFDLLGALAAMPEPTD